MNFSRNKKNNSASSFLEYALVIGIASGVFMAMNTYVQKGLQGRVKVLTDRFIGEEQAVDANPTAKTTSNTETHSSSKAVSESFIGSGTRITSLDTSGSYSSSTITDEKEPDLKPHVANTEGFTPVVERGKDSDFEDPTIKTDADQFTKDVTGSQDFTFGDHDTFLNKVQNNQDIKSLEQERDNLIAQKDAINLKINAINDVMTKKNDKGETLIQQVIDLIQGSVPSDFGGPMNCHGKVACRNGRAKMDVSSAKILEGVGDACVKTLQDVLGADAASNTEAFRLIQEGKDYLAGKANGMTSADDYCSNNPDGAWWEGSYIWYARPAVFDNTKIINGGDAGNYVWTDTGTGFDSWNGSFPKGIRLAIQLLNDQVGLVQQRIDEVNQRIADLQGNGGQA